MKPLGENRHVEPIQVREQNALLRPLEAPFHLLGHIVRQSSLGKHAIHLVHIGEEKVYRAKSRSSAEVKVYEEGEVLIWAKTESKEILPMEIKLGGEYYVRCSVVTGLVVGRPLLEKVSASSGKVEYESIKK